MGKPAFYLPHIALRPYIQTYIHLEMSSNIHDIIPTGNTQIFFVLNENYKVIQNSNNDLTAKKFFFSSPGIQSMHVVSEEIWSCVGIIFQPFGAYHLFQIPQFELVGQFPDMENLLPPSVKEVQHKIEDNAEDILKITEIFDDWLLGLLATSKIESARITYASHIIQQSKGIIKIEELCSQLFLSKRTLELEFREKIGLSPKMFSRVMRFSEIEKMLSMSPKTDFQKICLDFNYYDQAHFIKEFKNFSGFSPSKYFLRKDDMGSKSIH